MVGSPLLGCGQLGVFDLMGRPLGSSCVKYTEHNFLIFGGICDDKITRKETVKISVLDFETGGKYEEDMLSYVIENGKDLPLADRFIQSHQTMYLSPQNLEIT